jgi:hypothetical protein
VEETEFFTGVVELEELAALVVAVVKMAVLVVQVFLVKDIMVVHQKAVAVMPQQVAVVLVL